MLKKLLIKMVGKRLGAHIQGVSRTKVIAVIAVAIYAIETLAPAFGWDVKIPEGLIEALAAAGLYTLRDAIKEGKDDQSRDRSTDIR